MDCKECGLLLKEVALLQALLKIEENKVEELRKILDRIRESDNGSRVNGSRTV